MAAFTQEQKIFLGPGLNLLHDGDALISESHIWNSFVTGQFQFLLNSIILRSAFIAKKNTVYNIVIHRTFLSARTPVYAYVKYIVSVHFLTGHLDTIYTEQKIKKTDI